ncbi:MAG: T9SS type A sorting domain-containing protein [Bacteroidales bacterium]|nr:T9SS type A sorting domain-containing protein [Bacteroidales bacterium]
MKTLTLIILFVIFSIPNILGQLSCDDAYPISSMELFSVSLSAEGVINETTETDCLMYCINPNWFQFFVEEPGDLFLEINGGQNDIDFVCWGPFNNLINVCDIELINENVVDCSWSPATCEFCNITQASAGSYYILLISNFSQNITEINIEFGGDAIIGDPASSPATNSPVCEGTNLYIGIGETEGATYQWSGPNGFESTEPYFFIENALIMNSGIYSLEMNNNGEINSYSIEVLVNSNPAISAGMDVDIFKQQTVLLNGTIEGDENDYSVEWSPFNLITEPYLLITETYALTDTVAFTLTVTNLATSCIANDQIIVNVLDADGVYANDKENIKLYPVPTSQILFIELEDHSNYERIEIYNSIGQLIFSDRVSETKMSIKREKFEKAGIYFVSLIKKNGGKQIRKIAIE